MESETRRQTPSRISLILEDADGLTRREVLDRIAPVVYDELRALAAVQLRDERSDHTLQPTALVNEAYVRLLGDDRPAWSNRLHFFRAAALAMRRVLIEHARKRQSLKRGGEAIRVSFDRLGPLTLDEPEKILALDEALHRLSEKDPRAAEVVQLRYFAGMTVAEAAETLEISARTVKREWAFARAWLKKALR